MDAFRAYTFGTASYLALQSLPLLLSPKLIVNLLADQPQRTTDLETYLCRSLGLATLAIAVLSLLLSGILPLTNEASLQEADGDGAIKDPYVYPVLITTTTYHALQGFYLYTQTTRSVSFAFGSGLAISSILFFLGVGIALFGSEKGHVSKKTGADKRTSNWPFENKESAREKKKESRRTEKLR